MAPVMNKTSVLFLVALVAVSAALLSCDASDSNKGGSGTGTRAAGWNKLCEAWEGCKDPVNATVPSLCQIDCRDKGYDLSRSGCKMDGRDMMCCCFK